MIKLKQGSSIIQSSPPFSDAFPLQNPSSRTHQRSYTHLQQMCIVLPMRVHLHHCAFLPFLHPTRFCIVLHVFWELYLQPSQNLGQNRRQQFRIARVSDAPPPYRLLHLQQRGHSADNQCILHQLQQILCDINPYHAHVFPEQQDDQLIVFLIENRHDHSPKQNHTAVIFALLLEDRQLLTNKKHSPLHQYRNQEEWFYH